NPPGESEPVGYRALAPVDDFLQRYRVPVIVCTVGAAIVGAPLLFHVTFDFDPIHLRNPKIESVATLREISSDARVGTNAANVVMPSLDRAVEAARKLRDLPEVASAMTLKAFVPADQQQKLATIGTVQAKLAPLLRPQNPPKPPTDAENVAAL